MWARQMDVLADKNELDCTNHTKLEITLGELIERYIRTVVPKKRSAYYETTILRAVLNHSIQSISVKDLNTTDFARYRDERLNDISSASLRRQLNPLQHMFEIARKEWKLPIKVNPIKELSLKVIDKRRERRLYDCEYEKLINAAKTRQNPYIEKVTIFAIETAMRRGEILKLHWKQVDLKRRCVTILEAKNDSTDTQSLCTLARFRQGP